MPSCVPLLGQTFEISLHMSLGPREFASVYTEEVKSSSRPFMFTFYLVVSSGEIVFIFD